MNMNKEEIPRFLYPWLRYLLARFVSVTWKQELHAFGIASKPINKTLLVFNARHTQTGQVNLYVDTTTDNLLELKHHTGFTNLSRWIMKLAI